MYYEHYYFSLLSAFCLFYGTGNGTMGQDGTGRFYSAVLLKKPLFIGLFYIYGTMGQYILYFYI